MLTLTAAPPPGGPQPQGWGRPRLVMTLLVIIAFLLGTTNADCRPPNVLPTAYCFTGAAMTSDTSVLYEWCADCGTNRFVTNDINDFLPSTINYSETKVAVGGGTVTSPCTGTVMVKSLDYGHIIKCTDVLYLPKCAKKLMPASQFLNKGCTMRLTQNEVHLIDKTKGPLLSGKEFDGLFFYHAQTVRPDSLNLAKPQIKTPPIKSQALFGVEIGKITANSADFSKKYTRRTLPSGILPFQNYARSSASNQEKTQNVRHASLPTSGKLPYPTMPTLDLLECAIECGST